MESGGEYTRFMAVAVFVFLAFCANVQSFEPFNVSYDHRALILGGKRRMLISAGIHYPRATPEMWPQLIAMSKEGGADVIETYTFWNAHEPEKRQYNFAGRYDIVKFAKLVHDAGLFMLLRIGPYVCAEWNFGGFPIWLRDIPDIEFRTDNPAFKKEMEVYVKVIVDLMKENKLFSWQGGPIILLQIENEYGNVESKYGIKGKHYIKWAADLAERMSAGVPWVMCKQTDAPSHIINSCNGFYCDGFKPNSYQKPVLWTEDWNGWYASWGGHVPHRPVEDNAFAVARFFQRGGSLQNYYMYFGGTNFGRTAGGPLQITSYDYDAPIDEYGILRQPKWGHLKDLHAAIKLCEPALISIDGDPEYIRLGVNLEAHVYKKAGTCAAFLANINHYFSATVHFNGRKYHLPAWSVSILPDCENVVFNTAKVITQTSLVRMKHWSTLSQDSFIRNHGNRDLDDLSTSSTWQRYNEPVGVWSQNAFSNIGILEHLNVTKDLTDYLWYFTSVNISESDALSLSEDSQNTFLVIGAVRDVIRIFVNGILVGSRTVSWVRVKQPLSLRVGSNEIGILTETVGLQNSGAFLEKDGAGVRGSITLEGLPTGTLDLTSSTWIYQVGLRGERLEIFLPERQDDTEWLAMPKDIGKESFVWYKTIFNAPPGNDPVALDLGSMGKGQVWVNGNSLGRYWTSYISPNSGCKNTCDYRGTYNANKCVTNCGEATQRWYHVPRSWLNQTNNLLVLFEEEGGNPEKIAINIRMTEAVCGQVSENDPPPVSVLSTTNVSTIKFIDGTLTPEVRLQCNAGQTIGSIIFASYGTPKGDCGRYYLGDCHASSSYDVVSKLCEGRESCRIPVSSDTFGGDPCSGILKMLAIQAGCSSESKYSTPFNPSSVA